MLPAPRKNRSHFLCGAFQAEVQLRVNRVWLLLIWENWSLFHSHCPLKHCRGVFIEVLYTNKPLSPNTYKTLKKASMSAFSPMEKEENLKMHY